MQHVIFEKDYGFFRANDKIQNENVSLLESGTVTAASAMVLALSRFLLALSGRAEICVELRKLCNEIRRDKRDVTFGRWELEPGWTRKARTKGGERKFIKLRSNCTERSRSNWKNLVFRLSIQREYRTAGYLPVKYRRDVKSGSVTFVSFLDASLAVLSEIKQYRRGRENPR